MVTNGYYNGGATANATPLQNLTQDLDKNVQILTDYIRSAGLEQPSWDRHTPATVLPPDAPKDIQIAKELLMDQALQIFQLASGPTEYLANVITGYHYMESMRWLSHFKIFDLVPLEGSISYAELAQKANVSEVRLKSIARMAITNRLFAEPAPGTIAHSATSAELLTNANIADQRVWMSTIITPTISHMVEAHEQWPTSTAPNHTPFNAAFKTDLPMYQYIAKQPELYKLFGRVMETLSKSPKSDLKFLVEGFNWAKLGKTTVVDVGGNIGHSCVAIAKQFPQLDFIVQDTAHVVAEGARHIQETADATIANRIKFQEYDFFQPQPIDGAGVYLFRQIFHNWDFDLCVKILSNVVSAMNKGSHVLIMDFVLPESGAVPAVSERVLRSRDMGMMQLFNSLERDLEAWSAITSKVDSRLKIKEVIQPFGSHLSVLDIVLE